LEILSRVSGVHTYAECLETTSKKKWSLAVTFELLKTLTSDKTDFVEI